MGFHERGDLQRLLREQIGAIAPDTLVISEEFGEWEDSRRRIDLLAIDKQANLVVIELKRTEDGGHMELQAIRYAAMVSPMTFDQAVDVFGRYLKGEKDPRAELLEFLGWEEPDDGEFAQGVRIVLASADFSKELTSSVLWLNDYGVDIRCIRLKPYDLDGRILVDVQQIIPLPEAETYQVQIREKTRKERLARTSNIDFTRFDVWIEGEQHEFMWKRNAIFLICKRLCDRGVSPTDISALFRWRSNRVWLSVDGTVDASKFKTQATEMKLPNGAIFNPRRWFCEEGELLHFGGKTYAFSNQWGGENWFKAMNLLKENFPKFNINFAECATSEKSI